MADIRHIRSSDITKKGWEHAIPDHDLLIYGGGALFLRTDDLSGLTNDSGADGTVDGGLFGDGLDIRIRADQKIFIDGSGGSYTDIDINLFGVDSFTATNNDVDNENSTDINGSGNEKPLYITNIGGQVIIEKLTVNGVKNAVITGKYDPINGTGNVKYKGHDRLGTFESTKGNYGIHLYNPDENQICLGLLFDQYGSIHKSSSDIEVNYIEAEGGFAGIQIKADHLSDTGLDYSGDPTGSTPPVDTELVSTMFNMKINNCYIHDNGDEGIYLGHTSQYGDRQHSIHVRIENNRFLRTGREAIQVGRLIPNMANYAVDTDDSVSEWKSVIKNNIIMSGASNWLRANPNGAYNSQDMGMQLGCRNGGVEVAYNIIGGGGEFNIFFQMDGSGDDRTGNYAWIGDSEDVDTHVWIHTNYFIGSKWSSIYCQKNGSTMDLVTNSYITIQDNYFDEVNFIYDIIKPYSAASSLIRGNNNISYIDLVDNTVKDNTMSLYVEGGFSPTTSRLTDSGTTVDVNMDLLEFVNSGYDDATRSYLEYEHIVSNLGASGGGVQSDVSRVYTVDYLGTIGAADKRFFRCILEHKSNETTLSETATIYTSNTVTIESVLGIEDDLEAGKLIRILNHTSNNGDYTIASVAEVSGDTVVTIEETFPATGTESSDIELVVTYPLQGDWETFWEIETWGNNQYPSDDVRLIVDSTYHLLGIGLSGSYDTVLTSNPTHEGSSTSNFFM